MCEIEIERERVHHERRGPFCDSHAKHRSRPDIVWAWKPVRAVEKVIFSLLMCACAALGGRGRRNEIIDAIVKGVGGLFESRQRMEAGERGNGLLTDVFIK